MDGIAEFLKDKFGPTLPGWLVAIGFIVLIFIFIFAKAFGADLDEPLWSTAWIAGIAAELSVALLSAIVVGAVLKVLVVQGYFETALTEIVFGERGLDRIGGQRRIELWKALTCRIHAPLIHERLDKDQSLREFYDTLLRAEEKQISYNQNFYIYSVNRDMEFTWLDEAKGIVQITDFLTSNLVPFDPTSSISWKSSRVVRAGEKIADYKCDDTNLNIAGEEVAKRIVETINEGREIVTTYTLSGQTEYEISRTRVQSWAIDNDPILRIASPYIIADGIFKIQNRMNGTNLLFQELGGDGLFSLLSGPSLLKAGGELRRSVATVLLPQQGFQIIMLRGDS